MDEKNIDWRELFLGREEELEWILDGWKEAVESSSPRVRVLTSDSGYGKTKLAQRFYTELSRQYDADDYWPDILLNSENNLRVMPDAERYKPADDAVVPWFWFGLRWPDEKDRRNELESESPFLKVYSSPDFTVHEDAVLRRFEKKKRVRRVVFKSLKMAGKVGLNCCTLGVGGDVVEGAAGVVGYFLEGLSLLGDGCEVKGLLREELKHSDSIIRKRAESKLEVIMTFKNLISRKKKGEDALPVVLFLDNVHTMDEFSLECLELVWNAAKNDDWPLLVLATHWEREWNEGLNGKPAFSGSVSTFAEFCLRYRDGDEESFGMKKLGVLPECESLLGAAFPGLSVENKEKILNEVSGNPRHLSEVIMVLEGMVRDERSASPSFEKDGDLSRVGVSRLWSVSLGLEELERRRFDKIEFVLKDLLGVGSMQGVRYIKKFVIQVADRVDKLADNKGSLEMLGKAVDPFAVSEAVSRFTDEFRSINLHRLAEKHFELEYGEEGNPEGFAIVREAVLAVGKDILLPEGWSEVEEEDVDYLLDYLYLQGDEELCVLAASRALFKIYRRGGWGGYGIWRERWDRLGGVVNTIPESMTGVDRLWLLHCLGYIFIKQREWSKAEANYLEALDICKNTGQENNLGGIYHQLGLVYEKQRKWDEAEANYGKALTWKERTGQEHELGGTYHQLGMVFEEQRKWEKAEKNYCMALKWDESTGQEHELGGTYHQLGRVYEEQRKWDKAEENYGKALIWNERTGQVHRFGGIYHQLGMVYEKQRKWEKAEKNYCMALKWDESTGQEHELGGTYHQLGRVYEEQRKWGEAEENYREALIWKERTGQEYKLGGTYHQLGIVFQKQGKWYEANDNYDKALICNKSSGQEHLLGATYHHIGMVYQIQGKWDEAEANYREALAWNVRKGQYHKLGVTYHHLGMVFQEQSKWMEAEKNYGKSLMLNKRTGQEHELGGTYHQLGMTYEEQGKWAEAEDNFGKALEILKSIGLEYELGKTYMCLGHMYHAVAGEALESDDMEEVERLEEAAAGKCLQAFDNLNKFQPHMIPVYYQVAGDICRDFRDRSGAKGELCRLIEKLAEGIGIEE